MDLNIRGENYRKISGSIKLQFVSEGLPTTRKFKFTLSGAIPTFHAFVGVNGRLDRIDIKLGSGFKSSRYTFVNHSRQFDTKICNVVLADDYSFAYLDGFIVSSKKRKCCSCL
nr:hypothetical protein K-LCC10_0402 [Kaumoebavirus]